MLYAVLHRLSCNCKELSAARSRSDRQGPGRWLSRATRALAASVLFAGLLCGAGLALAQGAPGTAAATPGSTATLGSSATPRSTSPGSDIKPNAPSATSAAPGTTSAAAGETTPGTTPAAPGASPPAGDASAPADAAPADTRGLDEQVQGLKKDVVDLNRDLFVLEEELLYPANTQVAVFLSMDVGDFFALDSVQLKIDQKEVINYLYTPREVEALMKGGIHRLYVGNLKVGKHELVAFFSGKGPNDRAYKRGATLTFEKGIGAKYLELKINDRQRRLQPEFEIKDWE